MHAPLLSTVTLAAELVIAGIIFYIFYSGYAKNKLPEKLAWSALAYEVILNVGYMIYRSAVMTNSPRSDSLKMIGAFHGILSLLVFIVVIAYLLTAIRRYRKDINFFKGHPILTGAIIFFWILSLASGLFLYALAYG